MRLSLAQALAPTARQQCPLLGLIPPLDILAALHPPERSPLWLPPTLMAALLPGVAALLPPSQQQFKAWRRREREAAHACALACGPMAVARRRWRLTGIYQNAAGGLGGGRCGWGLGGAAGESPGRSVDSCREDAAGLSDGEGFTIASGSGSSGEEWWSGSEGAEAEDAKQHEGTADFRIKGTGGRPSSQQGVAWVGALRSSCGEAMQLAKPILLRGGASSGLLGLAGALQELRVQAAAAVRNATATAMARLNSSSEVRVRVKCVFLMKWVHLPCLPADRTCLQVHS